MRLLIVEDHPDIAKALSTILTKHNYSVDVLYSGDLVFDYIETGAYDGLILDLMLPGMDGLEVLRKLRQNNYTLPVLILTAKGELEDRVAGLDTGADDYLCKPFAMTELLARVRAMLRRTEHYSGEQKEFAGVTLNRTTYKIQFQSRGLHLVNREFQLMELFFSNSDKIITTEMILDKVWGLDSEVDTSTVWVYISNLRKKLQALEAPLQIRAIRGVGYVLEANHVS